MGGFSHVEITSASLRARLRAAATKSVHVEPRTMGESIMRKLMLLCACLCAVAFAVAAGPAQATNPRSWVSNSGSDSNTCTLASPCLTFAHAITQTTAGGEVDCLTPGD